MHLNMMSIWFMYDSPNNIEDGEEGGGVDVQVKLI